MRILVCITCVPDTTSKISFIDNNTKFNSAGINYIIGPYDDYALARAVELKEQMGGHITVINVGKSDTEPVIRKALAIGADDAVRVDAEPIDSHFVAAQIAAYAKNNNFDLILMGRESIDYNGGAVHGMVGEMLGLEVITPVMRLDVNGREVEVDREIEGGKETLKANMPLVLGCQEPIAEWKIPSMRGIMSARTKPLQVLPPVATDKVVEVVSYELPPAKSGCKMVPADQVQELVSLLKNEAKVI